MQPSFIYAPSRVLYGISIESEEPLVKVLGNLMPILGEMNVEVLHVLSSIRGGRCRTVVFLDLTDSKGDPGRIVGEVSRAFKDAHVEPIKPIAAGMIADLKGVPQIPGAHRVIMFTDTDFKGLIKGLKDRIGEGAAMAILYNLGLELGKSFGVGLKIIGKKLGVHGPREIFRKIFMPLFQITGFGVAEATYENISPFRLIVRVEKSFECELSKGSGKPSSFFTRGLMVGVVEELFGISPIVAIETACIARGDPHCEIVFLRRKEESRRT